MIKQKYILVVWITDVTFRFCIPGSDPHIMFKWQIVAIKQDYAVFWLGQHMMCPNLNTQKNLKEK